MMGPLASRLPWTRQNFVDISNSVLNMHLKDLPTCHLHSNTGREHEEIQEAKVGLVIPGDVVLLCKPRDDRVITLQLSIALLPVPRRHHFRDSGVGKRVIPGYGTHGCSETPTELAVRRIVEARIGDAE